MANDALRIDEQSVAPALMHYNYYFKFQIRLARPLDVLKTLNIVTFLLIQANFALNAYKQIHDEAESFSLSFDIY